MSFDDERGIKMNIMFANRLVALRKAHGLSQEELASRIGVSRQAISKWERVEASPDTYNLVMLANVYGITLDELINGTKTDTGDTYYASQSAEAKYTGNNSEAHDEASREKPLDSNDIRYGFVFDYNGGEKKAVIGGAGIFFADNGKKKIVIDRSGITIKENGKSRHAPWKNLVKRFKGRIESEDGECYVIHDDGTKEKISWSDVWDESMDIGVDTENAATEADSENGGYSEEFKHETPDDSSDDETINFETENSEYTVDIGKVGLKFKKRAKSPVQKALLEVPVPIICTVAFLLLGFIGNLWHPGWLVFLAVPVYYSLIHAIFSRSPQKAFNSLVPVIVPVAYLIIGLLTDVWHPTWLIMLIIPVYYCVVSMAKYTGVRAAKLFPIWAFAVAAFFLAGFLYSQWTWCWAILLIIPFYYLILDCIEKSVAMGIAMLLAGILLIGAYIAIGVTTKLWHPAWLLFLAWSPITHTIETIGEHKSFKHYVAEFPYFVVCTGVYLCLGLMYGMWHPWWLLIPGSAVVSSICNLLAGNRKWSGISFGAAITVTYLVLGIGFDLWHPWWILFLTIPIFEYIASLVKKTHNKDGNEYEVHVEIDDDDDDDE